MARGDQIYVYREFFNLEGVYEHHGVDCGDGTVIHYRKPSETVERTSIETFARGNRLYTREYAFRYIPDTAIRRAESRLGERKYNLLVNNCEHFATWCVTGVSDSRQIQDFVPILNQLSVDNLFEPIQEALIGTHREDAPQLLNKALAEIRVAWDDVHPQYKQALKEMESWDRVAREALQRDREDLARQALLRKNLSKKRAQTLEENLDKIAKMTETLLKSQSSLGY
ncbi:MAG: NC domain-containing protein [Oscillatoriales cyanobacterium RM1_1_9]|nr:NC domain-containing protein [Oscillatoriales cyanobacterium SM2_3_0]NJO44807.1 NC domain-containing protein [Oscillatoriales cyanobacterium RM2_1_1]NJO71681.1 NC domain-containing protein [Oscillatoriales cyanobacterium RM1_1_9]